MASLLNPTSLLGVLDTRDEQEARESVTHLLYVATITDKEAARRFHKDVRRLTCRRRETTPAA